MSCVERTGPVDPSRTWLFARPAGGTASIRNTSPMSRRRRTKRRRLRPGINGRRFVRRSLMKTPLIPGRGRLPSCTKAMTGRSGVRGVPTAGRAACGADRGARQFLGAQRHSSVREARNARAAWRCGGPPPVPKGPSAHARAPQTRLRLRGRPDSRPARRCLTGLTEDGATHIEDIDGPAHRRDRRPLPSLHLSPKLPSHDCIASSGNFDLHTREG